MRFLGTWRLLFVLGACIELCMIGMLVLDDLGNHIPIFFLFYSLAGLAYICAVCLKTEMPMWGIWVGAILFRVTLLFSTPSLSDDIFRYVWDGRVVASGINPYLFAPQSEFLAPLRDSVIHPFINHPDLPTIYPPVAQGLFFIGYVFFDSVLGLKCLLVGVDLLVGWVLVKLLQLHRLEERAVLVYLWHPLILVEGAGSGHVDFLGVLGVLLAFWFWLKQQDGWACVCLAGAILTKFLPLLFVPMLVRWSWKWYPQNWRALLWLPVCCVVGYIPFVLMGGPLWGSLGTYAVHWEFNSPIFWILRHGLGDGYWARLVIGGGLLCVLFWVVIKRKPPLVAGFIMMASFMLGTPTLHPWYLIWLIPFLVLVPHRAWLAFSLVVVCSYEVLIDYRNFGIWEESLWVWGVEFGILLILGIWGHFGSEKSKTCMS